MFQIESCCGSLKRFTKHLKILYPNGDSRVLNKSCPRKQQDYTDTAILLDGGFLLLRYSEFQFVFAFFTEEFDDQFAAIVICAVNTFFIYVPSSIWI